MAGDLEDFLRRAAERRAQKQQQAGGGGAAPQRQAQQRPPQQRATPQRPTPQQPAQQQRRPEYSDSRRERQIRQPVEEAIPIAEIIDEPVNPLAEKQRRLAKSKKKAAEAKERMAQQQRDIHEGKSEDRGVISIAGGTPAEQLLDLIRRPGGIQQAFLLREILDRPEDRWS